VNSLRENNISPDQTAAVTAPRAISTFLRSLPLCCR
jgi:hypothetical protein